MIRSFADNLGNWISMLTRRNVYPSRPVPNPGCRDFTREMRYYWLPFGLLNYFRPERFSAGRAARHRRQLAGPSAD